MNTEVATQNKVQIAPDGQPMQFLKKLPRATAEYLVGEIYRQAQRATDQMVVLSMTFDDKWPHIERAIKVYRWSPGIRVLFHCTVNPVGIFVDRIDWRDCEPYRPLQTSNHG